MSAENVYKRIKALNPSANKNKEFALWIRMEYRGNDYEYTDWNGDRK